MVHHQYFVRRPRHIESTPSRNGNLELDVTHEYEEVAKVRVLLKQERDV